MLGQSHPAEDQRASTPLGCPTKAGDPRTQHRTFPLRGKRHANILTNNLRDEGMGVKHL